MRRNISSVLVVIVGVILAVDVVLRLAPQEAAGFQEPELRIFPEPPVRIIQIAAAFDHGHAQAYLWRLWSDGVIEDNNQQGGAETAWRGWKVVADVPAP